MITRLKRMAVLAAAGVVLAGGMPVISRESASAVAGAVRAGCERDYPPFCMVHADGRVDGFSVDLLRAAMQEMGREVTFQSGVWDEVRGWLERGDIDALPLVGRTPEREAVFDFTVPYLTMHGALVVRVGTDDIRSLADLSGRRVAVMKGDNAEEFLRREAIAGDLVTTPSFVDAFRLLAEGGCDAVLVQRLMALRLLQESGVPGLRVVESPVTAFRQDFCFAVKAGDHETLAMLNEGLALVMADGTYRRLYARWFASQELPYDRRLIYGGDSRYPPFEFLAAGGRPSGFSVDMIRAVAAVSGLDVDVRLGAWAEMVAALESGTVDVLSMFYSPERELRFAFSPAYAVNHCVGVVRQGSVAAPMSFADLEGMRLVVEDGDMMHTRAVAHGLEEQLTVVGSQAEALRLLAAGQFDCALVARSTALHWMEANTGHPLMVGRVPLHTAELCFAVTKENQALLAALSEGLHAVKQDGGHRELYQKWMAGHDEPTVPVGRLLRYAAFVAVPLVLLFLVLLFWSWSLRRLVAARTAALQRSETRFRQIYEHVAVGIARVSLDFHIEQANPAYCQMLGYEEAELIGKHLADISHPDVLEANIENQQLLGRGQLEHYRMEKQFIHRNGYTVYGILDANLIHRPDGRPDFFLGSVADISSLKYAEAEHAAMQAQLLQSQKLESVGRLAGGVAHDFNNLLMGIMGYAELCLDEIGPDHAAREWLDEIVGVTKRSADLTRQLLAFARRQTVAPQRLVLNDAVEGLLKMLRRVIGEDIELVWIPTARATTLLIDPSQVDQLLTNLCINARDAIGGAGTITIESAVVTLDDAYCKDHTDALPGTFVVLVVSDDGCGMDAETQTHIFEPFYSTKEVGKGSGLGLATVYGILQQNHGFIHVYSEPGNGTTLRLYLPLAEDDAAAGAADGHAGGIGAHQRRGSETILLVEDEASVRVTTSLYLRSLGYNVLTAEMPEKAQELASAHDGTIELLVTDVVMPGMNGRELARALARSRPGMRCLYISGYMANVIAHRGILDDNVHFLSKPFAREALAAKVRDVLDETVRPQLKPGGGAGHGG